MDAGRYIQTVKGVGDDLLAGLSGRDPALAGHTARHRGAAQAERRANPASRCRERNDRGADARQGPSFWRQDSYLRVTPPRDRR
jgi:hypothetical protein